MDHPLKQNYSALKPASESSQQLLYPSLTNLIVKSLGVYSGDIRLVPMMRGDSEPSYRYVLNRNASGSSWMENLERAFSDNRSWRAPNSPVVNTPVIKDPSNNKMSFVFKDYAIEVMAVDNDMESVCLYEGYGQVGKIFSEFARKMGVVMNRNGVFIELHTEGGRPDAVKVNGYIYDFLYHMGLLNGRHSNPYYTSGNGLAQIISSKYFSKQIFDEEARVRLSDCHFFQKIKDLPMFLNAEDRHDYTTDRAPWVTWLKRNFPGAIVEAQAIIRNQRKNGQISAKYNDDLIKTVISSDEPAAIKTFRENMISAFRTESDLEDFILASAPDTLRSKMEQVFSGNFERKTIAQYGPETSFVRSLPETEDNFDPAKVHTYQGFKYRIVGVAASKNLNGKITRTTVTVRFSEVPTEYRNTMDSVTRTYVTTGYDAFYKQ